jgi:predicted dehydrogenase
MMKLTILDPGHFHAALVQKNMYANVDTAVRVYAPAGPDVDDYLRKIESYNAGVDDPTRWRVLTHTGPDFLERFVADRSGGVVIIAGNNRRKTRYLACAVAAGSHTLADKPMAIDAAGFEALSGAFTVARENGVLLYDIMTERHEITTMLQRAFSTIAPVFGNLQRGTVEHPAVIKESVHHFSKLVSGVPIKRPAWFFDAAQQGEGLVDVATHLVDLVQWGCFPEQSLDYRADIRITSARRWTTAITPAQFAQVTQCDGYPVFLQKDVYPDGSLHIFTNGAIDYTIRGVHGKVSALWNFEPPASAGDTHFSVMRGSGADLVIRQGQAEAWQPALYIEPPGNADLAVFAHVLEQALSQVQATYPGVGLKRTQGGWEVTVPAILSRRPRSSFRPGCRAVPALRGERGAAGVGSSEHAGQVLHDHPRARDRQVLTCAVLPGPIENGMNSAALFRVAEVLNAAAPGPCTQQSRDGVAGLRCQRADIDPAAFFPALGGKCGELDSFCAGLERPRERRIGDDMAQKSFPLSAERIDVRFRLGHALPIRTEIDGVGEVQAPLRLGCRHPRLDPAVAQTGDRRSIRAVDLHGHDVIAPNAHAPGTHDLSDYAAFELENGEARIVGIRLV